MPVLTLDTHAVVKELQDAGFTEAQAEAVTHAVRKSQDIDFSDLATRADLHGLELATKADLHELKSDFQVLRGEFGLLGQSIKSDIDGLREWTKAAIAELKSDMMRLMMLQPLAVVGAVAGLFRLMR